MCSGLVAQRRLLIMLFVNGSVNQPVMHLMASSWDSRDTAISLDRAEWCKQQQRRRSVV
jgi:hypothetical protein